LLIALRDIPNERIELIRDAMLSVALSAQKLRFEPVRLKEDLERIFKLFPAEAMEWNYFEMTLVYILRATDLSEKDLTQSLEVISSPIKERIMSTYDRILLKGIEKGIEKDRTEVILKSYKQGLHTSLISNIVTLPESEVIKILVENGIIKN